MTDLTLTNARIVLPDAVVEGTVHVRDGRIADVSEGRANGSDAAPNGAIDMEGDTIVPGLVELHTDHVETHFTPRPGVRWDPTLAVVAHDAQIAGSGITTVFDALCIGMDEDRAESQLSLRFGHFSVPVLSQAWPMDQTWERIEAKTALE